MRRFWSTATDIGDRQANEDSQAVRHGSSTAATGDHPMAVLCDGMGGEANGELASWHAQEAFRESYEERNPEQGPRAALAAALDHANDAVRDHGRGGETTLVAAAVTDAGLQWTSAGDSQLYIWRKTDGTLEAINPRHNPPGRPHELLSALMGGPIPEVAAGGPVAVAPGDRILLASDGLDTVGHERVATIAGAVPACRLAQTLVRETLVRAAEAAGRGPHRQDNVTVISAEVHEPVPEPHPGCVHGRRIDGQAEITVDGRPLRWRRSLAVRNHSPSGPEWGYRGSGPAQLALAVLLDVLRDRERAQHLYQGFKEWSLPHQRSDTWSIGIPVILEWASSQ